MKAFLLLLIMAASALAEVPPTPAQLREWIQALQTANAENRDVIVPGLRKENGDLSAENQRLQVALNAGTQAIVLGEQHAAAAVKELADMKQWGLDRDAAAIAAAKDAATQKARSQKRGTAIGLLGGAILALVATHLIRLIPQYGIFAPFVAFPIGWWLANFLVDHVL